ncbi:MAG: hypothetical protein L0154_02570 [Chloroflexi bacterium]|nr:hypothetical protein [Chloroflexota bacterium]
MRQNLRISIIGPKACGKSTFLKSFVPTALDTDDYGTLNPNRGSMTHARYTIDDDLILDILAIRVPEKDSLLSIILEGMAGHIFMLDSTMPEGWFDLKRLVKNTNAPAIIVANKQDHPLAHSMTAIRSEMATTLPIYPCDATDAELVKKIVLDLLYLIIDDVDA